MRLNPITNPQSISVRSTAAAQNGHTEMPHPDQAQGTARTEQDPEALEKAVERLNNMVKNSNRMVEFQINDHNRLVIKVIDRNTNEVVQQIPSERLLKVLEGIDELLGHLLDHKA